MLVAHACSQLKAQDINENDFTLYTKQQGLSNNSITGIAQDSIGYLWIATAYGLNRFNGNNFVQFHSSRDSLSLPEEYLSGLVWLNNRRLAAFSSEGLHIIDTRTGARRNLLVPYPDKQYQYKFNGIMAVRSNSGGDVFVVTRSGFYHFDRNYQLVFRFDYYSKQEVARTPFAFGRNLLAIDDKRFVVVSSDGLYYYNAPNKQFGKMKPADCPKLQEFLDYHKTGIEFFQLKPGRFIVMNPDSNSLIYVDIDKNKKTAIHIPFRSARDEFDYRSTLVTISDTLMYLTGNVSGFYKIRLDPQSGKIEFYQKKYFPFYFCRYLLEDKDKNLWVATNKGLLKQDNRQLHIQQSAILSSILDSFPNSTIDDIYANGKRIYVATRGESGLLIFNRSPLQFIKRIDFQKLNRNPNAIYALAPARDTSLFIASNGPLYSLNLKTNHAAEVPLDKWNKLTSWVSDLCRDRQQNIWIASGNIYKYDIITKKSSLVIDSAEISDKIQWPAKIKEDASGNIWAAGHGLLRYNVKLNKIDQVIDSFPSIRFPDNQIPSFTADQFNNLWINSNHNGLIRYDIEKRIFQHFTRDDGLLDNDISSMIVVGTKLWMASISGISCLDLKSFKISSFGKEDGFPDLAVPKDSRFFYDSTLNKLYIGFTNMIVQFDPGIIFQRSRAPHLFIESIITGDQKKFLFPGENFTTSWRNNEVTITIGSINFSTNNSQRFAYRLLKADKTDWQQLGTQNTFSISNLSAGHHHVQVKLFSLSNRWPEQVKEFDIIILPPFWQRTWFTLAGLIMLMVSVYLLFKWRTGVIRKKEQAKTHIQTLKAEEYKSQFELEQITNYFSSSLAGKKNVDDVLWDVAKNLIGRMNYVDCMIYLWNDDKTKMIQKASYGPKGNPQAIMDKVFDVAPGQGVVGHVMKSREALLIPDTSKDRRYRVDDIKRLSELCVPIIHNNELIGIIDSEHHNVNHFKERDIKILTTIATLVGNKIAQIESEQSLEVKQKEIAFINQQLAEAQLSALQTQMNPHFIFNSLNSIKGMILSNEQQKASRYLSKFAQMIRITLNQSKEIFTTLSENLEHLENYLVMEKLRFGDSFTFHISVDDRIDKEEMLIPTLMIQPLSENAIWHGLMCKEGEKKLSIRFCLVGETVSCIIEDNGIGIRRSEQLKQLNKPSHQSVGLSNLRNRIKIMNEKYGAGCTLEIIDLYDLDKSKTGTRATLRFNIISIKQQL
jgi:ligand-binding sensor domain-containing protein/putative methionine-R-sulfoxide reductase with GAF domain